MLSSSMAASTTLTVATIFAQQTASATAQTASPASGIPYQDAMLVIVGAIFGFGGLFMALNQIKGFFGIRGKADEIRPQPLQIAAAPRYATLEEVESMRTSLNDRLDGMEAHVGNLRTEVGQLRGEITGLRSEIHSMEMRSNERGEKRAIALHDRINEVLAAVSELRGEVTAMKETEG